MSHASPWRLSPSPSASLRPFDRRFQSRLSSASTLASQRPLSPAFLNVHSRQSSLSGQITKPDPGEDSPSPWEVVRWTKLKNLSAQAFSEVGKRNFGRPTCIAVSAAIALGTSKGVVLLFDYHQTLKSIIGPGTKSIEAGAVTSLAISADHATVASGHATGNIFTWDIAKSARPFLHIAPLHTTQLQDRKADGHVTGVAILHLAFLGTRHTALVSADDRGMAFSHLATRGLGAAGRSVKTQRVLGRYPNDLAATGRPRKPSTVLAFSALPLGNAEQVTDTMGLVAMLTPYLLVIVSTTPIAQTQHKAARPKEVAAHGALSGCLAWFPSVKLKAKDPKTPCAISLPKLVYCWSNVLTILDVEDTDSNEQGDREGPPSLSFRPRSRWKAEEAIVAVQWLGRSILGVLTITQQLIILEDGTLRVTDSFDLLQKHIYHRDVFSAQLQSLVEPLDGEDASMHGVVADAFYSSFRTHKGRIFLLGFEDVSVGTLSNWADRLVAMMENGDFIGPIRLATAFYNGETDILTVGLPDDNTVRHSLVEEKLLETISASLRYAFRPNQPAGERVSPSQLEQLAAACFDACLSMDATAFLFDKVFDAYETASAEGVFLEALEPYVLDERIVSLPPTVVKSLIMHYSAIGLETRLEEIICHLDTTTMDIDQVTSLCKQHNLFDALVYVWNQAIGDYITPLVDLLSLVSDVSIGGRKTEQQPSQNVVLVSSAQKMFPYLAYTLTSRIYPSGSSLSDDVASKAKADLYSFLFAGKAIEWPRNSGTPLLTHPDQQEEPSFPYLRLILEFDAPNFLSVLNEAFEDSYLNGAPEPSVNGDAGLDPHQDRLAGVSVNRQYIISILLEVMSPADSPPEDTIYLDMFIARNLPKFPQFILLSGTSLRKVIVGLCNYPRADVADDCQLSVEYLLSMYHPPDIDSLIPLFTKAGFYRVLKATFKADKQYAKLLETYFEDPDDQEVVFDCIGDILRTRAGLNDRQLREVRSVITAHAHDLAHIDTIRAAETLQTYAPDLHESIISSLQDDRHTQFIYVRGLLEPRSPRNATDIAAVPKPPNRDFVELYVRLMCDYDPSHVADYIEVVQAGDLRLDQVLPAMENSGVVDAAVVLMAREGKVRDAMDRLTNHLGTLEAALLGLLSGVADSPDMANTEEAMADLLKALEKYVHVGIWICQGQMKTIRKTRPAAKQAKRASMAAKQDLSPEEDLWLELIDAVVRITKTASSLVESTPTDPANQPTSPSKPQMPIDSSKAVAALRTLVQQTFTALLSSTTSAAAAPDAATPTISTPHPNLSFLRILRAFLTRASLSSPSLSDLRSVLASIFSAYAYEESLLALANRLLEKDLFVHVAHAAQLRQRGWRPGSQVCEGCGRRVWGPGAGGAVWEAWKARRADDARRLAARREQRAAGQGAASADAGAADRALERGKGRARAPMAEADAPLLAGPHGFDGGPAGPAGTGARPEEDLGPLLVFSCRHVFHRTCLERLRAGGRQGGAGHGHGAELACVVCR